MRTRDLVKEELVRQKTVELVVEEGLDNFSVNKLAKACGISVATLYIYYKDKDDLIVKVAIEEAKKSSARMVKGLDPELSFAEGLKKQWKNRIKEMKDFPEVVNFFEQVRASKYQEKVFPVFEDALRDKLGKFWTNAIKRGELAEMPVEVYWSIAFAPLYNLIRFHREGRSLANKPFKMTEAVLWQTFDLAVKALKK